MKLLLPFLIFSNLLLAQNLIPNPSFEQLTDCNTEFDYNFNATDWKNTIFNTTLNPTFSADVYNECNITIYELDPYWVPKNWLSFQYPHSGEGYAGVFCGINFELTKLMNRTERFFMDSIHEFTSCKLKEVLENRKYCISTWINSSNVNFQFINDTINNNFEYLFTKISKLRVGLSSTAIAEVNNYNFYEIEYGIDLYKDDSAAIGDTSAWELIRAPYFANGDEEYFILGNFSPDSLSGYQLERSATIDSFLNREQFSYNAYILGSYFNFDDVSLVPIAEPNIFFVSALGYPENYIWLIDTTAQEEKQWYKTGDDLLLGTGDSLLILATQGTQFSLYTRNCRVEQSDTLIIDYTGIAPETLRKQISITNNLTNTAFQVNYLGGAPIKMQVNIYNSIGQLVKYETITQSSSISVSELISGIYFCEVINNGDVLKRERLLKMND
jgi:hypothetical protein